MRPRIKCQPRIENDPDYKYARLLVETTGAAITKALQYIRKYDSLSRAQQALIIDNQVQQFKAS